MSRRTVLRLSTAVALACCGVLAMVGGVVLHGADAAVLVVAAGLVAGIAYSVGNDDAPRGAVAWKAAGATIAIGMVVTGVGVLAGATVAATVTVAAAVAFGGLVWLRRVLRRRSGGAAVGAPARPGPAAAPEPLWKRLDPPLPVSLLPTPALGGEWMQTTAALAGRLDPAARQEVVRRRAEALDELERRDPAGFTRWLTAGRGPHSDPADFVRGDRTTGTDAG